jgi:hypothetical protein
MRRDMSGNGLSELNGGVVAGEDDAVAGCHGEVVPFPEAIWRLGRLGSDAFCFVNLSGSRMTTPAARPAPGSHVARRNRPADCHSSSFFMAWQKRST